MDAQVRSSLTMPEASLLLERAGAQPGAPAVDTVLGCRGSEPATNSANSSSLATGSTLRTMHY